VRAVQEEAWLRRHLGELTARNEQNRPQPWEISDAPADFIAAKLRGIVGLQLSVDRAEGAWKMAQKRSVEDQRGVIEGLEASGQEVVAAVMRTLLDGAPA
jgi:transcriptional regulator